MSWRHCGPPSKGVARCFAGMAVSGRPRLAKMLRIVPDSSVEKPVKPAGLSTSDLAIALVILALMLAMFAVGSQLPLD